MKKQWDEASEQMLWLGERKIRVLGCSRHKRKGAFALVPIMREARRTPSPKHVSRMSDTSAQAGEKKEKVEVERLRHE